MAMPPTVTTATSKVAANGNKGQTTGGQGQGQGQATPGQSQAQGATPTAGQNFVAGKPAILPQQSGAPLMLGQIGE